jgi:hypothetical protein
MATRRDLTFIRDNLLIDRDLLLSDIKTQEIRASAGLPGAAAEVQNLKKKLVLLDAEIARVSQEISRLLPPSRISAGTTVKDNQAAKNSADDDNPNLTTPSTPNKAINPSGRIVPDVPKVNTNAIPTPTGGTGDVDRNTNGNTITYNDSQAEKTNVDPAFNVDSILVPGSTGSETYTPRTTGAGATEDTGQTRNATVTAIDQTFEEQISPKTNRLDEYATYIYSASVYMMDATAYNTFMKSTNKTLSGAQLLFQTAGAPVGGRNKYFKLDYYIDNLEIECVLAGKGTGQATNAYQMSMTVLEPHGITLVNNLDLATTEYIFKGDKNRKQAEWANQNYILVLRFYGYDSQGKKLVGGRPENAATPTDPNALIEKYIPFQITNLTFKVAGKATEYTLTATTTATLINQGSLHAVIPHNVEFGAQTLRDALMSSVSVANATDIDPGGRENNTTSTGTSPTSGTPTPLTANSAPEKKSTITKSLADALNQFQQNLVKQGRQKEPDVFSITMTDVIANARIKYIGGADKSGAPMSKPTTANQQLDKATQSTDFSSNTLTATAGTPIIKFIDLVVRNSTYIQQQAKVTIDPQTEKQSPNSGAGTKTAWFHINNWAEQGKWDSIRNDYAYTYHYVITPYYITGTPSDYFPDGEFRGIHKRYNYWFTGLNSQVLSYEQTYNTNFIQVSTGGPGLENTSSNYQYLVRRVNLPASNASRQGAPTTSQRQNEMSANMASYLYNPADLAESVMTIVGDPAWIFQGEVSTAPTTSNWSASPFLADDSINPESGQVYYEILFNTPADYNIDTGLLDPNKDNFNIDAQNKDPGQPLQSYIYNAYRVVNSFKQGKFTQQLEGTLYTYDPGNKAGNYNRNSGGASLTVADTSPQSQTPAETSRSLRQSNIGAAIPEFTGGASGPVLPSGDAAPDILPQQAPPPPDKDPG